MCEGLHRCSHGIHNFSTSTSFVQAPNISRFSLTIPQKFFRRKLHCTEFVQEALRKSPAIFQCFLSGRSKSKTPCGSAPIKRRFSSTRMVFASSRAPSGV